MGVGVLDEQHMKLDYVLRLKMEDFMERRLQTQVFKLGLAKSVHHARVLIRQRHIDFSLKSPLAGGRPGRVARKNKTKPGKGGDDEEEMYSFSKYHLNHL